MEVSLVQNGPPQLQDHVTSHFSQWLSASLAQRPNRALHEYCPCKVNYTPRCINIAGVPDTGISLKSR